MRDLRNVLMFGDHPIRLGVVEGEVVYCLSDLLSAVGRGSANVTYALKKVPEMLYFPVSTFTVEGLPINGKVIGVCEEGAIMALCRSSKIDLVEVYKVMKWMKKIDKKKLKGA